MDFFFYALIWSTLAILVGQYAKRRRRDERNWAALAFLISPLLAFLILTAIERAGQQQH
jgi:TctA family transporter